jgi:hypothetical protein
MSSQQRLEHCLRVSESFVALLFLVAKLGHNQIAGIGRPSYPTKTVLYQVILVI